MIKAIRHGVIMKPLEDQLGKFARFNPGVTVKGDEVYLLYRATDCGFEDQKNYISSIGFARLDLKGNVLFDSNKKVIYPTLPEEVKGCEDPRIVEFEGSYYIFYTAYDGETARVAVAKTNDFINYEKLGVIRHFTWDKDAYILPERVNGKIVYIHRIEPDIQVDYFDSIETLLHEESWENYQGSVKESTIMKSKYDWEAIKIGGSAPPIKTEDGWLMVYHGVDNAHTYRAGVVLLDKNNPSKVIARLPYPILEPVEDYELYGDVDNVVFPEGAYIYEGQLYIYYGCADKYIALATVDVPELLEELKKYPV